MIEQIDQLAARVEALVHTVEELRRRNEEAALELQRLRSENLAMTQRVEQEQADWQKRLQELERQLDEKTQRESHMRDRLQGILGRIDVIEQELGGNS